MPSDDNLLARTLGAGCSARPSLAHPEAGHEVGVALQRGAPKQVRHVVGPEREALRVVVAVLVAVGEVRVGARGVAHPLGQLDVHVVAHVGAARVEGHHRLVAGAQATSARTRKGASVPRDG